ncbi:hypothetical protein D3C77_229320 [compost metagenome]
MHAGVTRHPVAEQTIDQKQCAPHRRRADDQRGQWQVVGHRQGHLQGRIDTITDHIQRAFEFKVTGRPGQGDRFAGHVNPLTGYQQAFDPVIAQPFVEQVREVQS